MMETHEVVREISAQAGVSAAEAAAEQLIAAPKPLRWAGGLIAGRYVGEAARRHPLLFAVASLIGILYFTRRREYH